MQSRIRQLSIRKERITMNNDSTTRSCVIVTTENKIKIVNYPEDSYCSGDFIRKQLGNRCNYLEEVRPSRLYERCHPAYAGTPGIFPHNFGFHYPSKPYYDGGNIVMLVDDLGYAKGLPDNLIASWLYGSDVNGNPVKGNVLFIGCTSDFDDYCGIARKDLRRLAAKLYKLKLKLEGR